MDSLAPPWTSNMKPQGGTKGHLGLQKADGYMFIHGGFLSHGGTPSSHPFIDGCSMEIIHPASYWGAYILGNRQQFLMHQNYVSTCIHPTIHTLRTFQYKTLPNYTIEYNRIRYVLFIAFNWSLFSQFAPWPQDSCQPNCFKPFFTGVFTTAWVAVWALIAGGNGEVICRRSLSPKNFFWKIECSSMFLLNLSREWGLLGLFLIVVMDHSLTAYQVPGSFDPCLSIFIQFSGSRWNLWPSKLQH